MSVSELIKHLPKTSMIYCSGTILALVALTVIASCKSRTTSNLEGTFAAGSVMTGRSQRVCWSSGDSKSEFMMEKIKDIVTSEYSRAGINFSDWIECPERATPSEWLIVATEDKQPWAIYGCKDADPWCVQLNLKYEQWPADCDKKNLQDAWACNCQKKEYFQTCVVMNAIHEFGHAVGLAHEADRPDSVCAQKTSDNVVKTSFGPYDPESIMNYCYNQTIVEKRLKPRLSDGDIATISKIFENK